MLSTPRSLFRALAIAEAVTWTLLIAALITRAATGFAPAVTIAGGIHGFVFLSYGATAILLAVNQRWKPGVAVVAIASAIVPYATVPMELWLDRTRRLDGPWRRESTDDPRDAGWIDRTMRWLLRNPVILVLLVVAAVAALFTVLLILGPPGGK